MVKRLWKIDGGFYWSLTQMSLTPKYFPSGIYPIEMNSGTHTTWCKMGLFIINKMSKQPKCPSTAEWINYYIKITILLHLCEEIHACAQSLCCIQLFPTPQTVACQASLSSGIFQARILEWVAVSYSRGFSWPQGQTCVFCISCTGSQTLYHRVTWEA